MLRTSRYPNPKCRRLGQAGHALRIPVIKMGKETVGYAVPYPRSKPLKDSDHVLKLLNSYLKKDNELESLAEWETTVGKLPRGVQF